MKNPPDDLARRLLDVSEEALRAVPPPRLEDVARLVGASRATLYYYFAGRDDLLTFLLTSHARQGAQAVRAAVDPDDPPEARLRATIAALADYLGDHPGVCVGLVGAAGAADRMADALAANDTWIAGPLRELLAECRAAGVLAVDPAGDVDVRDAADAALGALLHAVIGRTAAGRDPADPAFRRRLRDQVLRGLLAA